MNIKNCKFGANIIFIISFSIITLLLKSSIVTLIFFTKYGLYQFSYAKILTDVVIVLAISIFVMLYYKTVINKDGIKGFTMSGKSHYIEWANITHVYTKKILLIDTIFIEENNKKIHIGLFGNFERFKICAEKFDKDNKLKYYLDCLTLHQIKSIKNNNKIIGLTGIIALILLLNIIAYTNLSWYPDRMLQIVQKTVEIKKAQIPRQLGEGILLENIILFPEQKQTEYTYILDSQCDEKFFDNNIRNVIENLIKTDFCNNKKAINYLNYGFSEIHNFHYLGCDEKSLISKILVDQAFCNN